MDVVSSILSLLCSFLHRTAGFSICNPAMDYPKDNFTKNLAGILNYPQSGIIGISARIIRRF